LILFRENPKEDVEKSALVGRRRSTKPMTKKQAATASEARVKRGR